MALPFRALNDFFLPASRLPLLTEERVSADFLLPELGPPGQVGVLVEQDAHHDHRGEQIESRKYA